MIKLHLHGAKLTHDRQVTTGCFARNSHNMKNPTLNENDKIDKNQC